MAQDDAPKPDEPKPADFEAAGEALGVLKKAIEDGAPLAGKSAAYAKFLANEKKAATAAGRRIEARRTAVIIAGWTASVEEAK